MKMKLFSVQNYVMLDEIVKISKIGWIEEVFFNLLAIRVLERRAPRNGAPERRSEKPERGRSATPEIGPERRSERNSEKGRSASWSARSDFYAKQNLEMPFIKKKNFARKRAWSVSFQILQYWPF